MVLLRMEGIRQRGFTDGENAAARCGGSVIRLWEMKSERERENKRTRQMGGALGCPRQGERGEVAGMQGREGGTRRTAPEAGRP
jgi:hypothetical protein